MSSSTIIGPKEYYATQPRANLAIKPKVSDKATFGAAKESITRNKFKKNLRFKAGRHNLGAFIGNEEYLPKKSNRSLSHTFHLSKEK